MVEKILVVDDEIDTLRLVGLTLQRQGYQVVAANNGEQALQMVHTEKPDVIILDVMMPDMDGFEVTRQLRDDPSVADIPILMFTARAQLDDKVTGYEVGADDYLTKPIHPAELVSHVKVLLDRCKERSGTGGRQHGYTIGVLAPAGGVGVSSITLNLAVILQQTVESNLIAAELRPGHGVWQIENSQRCTNGLNNLLTLKPEEIAASAVENELYRTDSGLRLLLSSRRIKDVEEIKATTQVENIVSQLSMMAPLVLLDIGSVFWSNYKKLLSLCHELIIVSAPHQPIIERTQTLLNELDGLGFGQSCAKPISIFLLNRIRMDDVLSVNDVKDALNLADIYSIPPTPEDAHQADEKGIPFVLMNPDSIAVQQYQQFAKTIAQRITQ